MKARWLHIKKVVDKVLLYCLVFLLLLFSFVFPWKMCLPELKQCNFSQMVVNKRPELEMSPSILVIAKNFTFVKLS